MFLPKNCNFFYFASFFIPEKKILKIFRVKRLTNVNKCCIILKLKEEVTLLADGIARSARYF